MSNQAVDTNGWHTVAAVHYADLNRAILAEGKTPPGFDIAASDGSAQAKGTFGPWSLQTGGSGPLIMMALPITGGTITIGGKATPITPCTATVKITASFLDEGTLKHTLQNDQTVPVSVESCLPKQPGFMGEAVLVELLGMWLNQNLGKFNAVFGAVDLDAEYVSEGLSWLKPSFKGYGVAEHAINPTLENSTFAILCLIDDQAPPDGLANMVSPYAIPDGCDAAFLLSPDKFLTHMMLASTPLMFQNIDNDPAGDHFVIDNQGTRISSTSSLTLKPFRLSGGKLVDSAVIDAGNFGIEISETELLLNITSMSFGYSLGVTIKLDYIGRSVIEYPTKDGNGAFIDVLGLTVVGESGGGSVEVSKALDYATSILGVTSALTGLSGGIAGMVGKSAAIAGKAAGTTALQIGEAAGYDAEVVASNMARGITGFMKAGSLELEGFSSQCFGLMKFAGLASFATAILPATMAILKAVADGDYQSLPKITDLTSSAIGKTVIWPAAVPEFTVKSAQLNGCLQFGLVHQSASPKNPAPATS